MARAGLVITVLSLAVAVTSGCAASRATPEDAAAAVLRADRAWAAAAASGDEEAGAAAVAADGIMFPSGAPPVIGRTAVLQHMREAMAIPGFSITWERDTVVVAASGDLAYALGRSRFTFPDNAGGLDTVYAKGVSVWRRDADGVWRVVVDISNQAPAPGEPILPVAR